MIVGELRESVHTLFDGHVIFRVVILSLSVNIRRNKAQCDNILKAVGKEKELDNGPKPKSSRERRALKKGK